MEREGDAPHVSDRLLGSEVARDRYNGIAGVVVQALCPFSLARVSRTLGQLSCRGSNACIRRYQFGICMSGRHLEFYIMLS